MLMHRQPCNILAIIRACEITSYITTSKYIVSKVFYLGAVHIHSLGVAYGTSVKNMCPIPISARVKKWDGYYCSESHF